MLLGNNTVGFVVFGSLDPGSFVLGSFLILDYYIELELVDCTGPKIVDCIEPKIVGCTELELVGYIEPGLVDCIEPRIVDCTELVFGCYSVLDSVYTKLYNDKFEVLLVQPIEFLLLLRLLQLEHKLVQLCMLLRRRACKKFHKLMMCKLERIHKELHRHHKLHKLRRHHTLH